MRKFKHIPGDIVECGVWRGGMMAGMAELLGIKRTYHLFDSFEGLPNAKEIDGEAAVKWQSETQSPTYYDNCRAEIRYAQTAMQKTNATEIRFHKGWFSETLKDFDTTNGIAILRLDADWYDSTKVILDHLFPLVNSGGIIILDDYYSWDGCSRALHDYLSDQKSISKIYQYQNKVCYLIKQ